MGAAHKAAAENGDAKVFGHLIPFLNTNSPVFAFSLLRVFAITAIDHAKISIIRETGG